MAPAANRSKSPGAARGGDPAKTDGGASASTDQAAATAAAATAAPAAPAAAKFEPPARPAGLRQNVLTLHVVLAAVMLFFSCVGQNMLHPVPEGKFEKKDGTLIDLADWDPVELGPYAKCHPHHGEHQSVAENGTTIWVQNSDVGSAGPFLVGHPENPAWVEKSTKEAIKQAGDEKFTWTGLQPQLHLWSLAILCVYLGSKHGVWLWTEPPETRESFQTIQSNDAYWFPIMGSCVLFGLFLVLKYLGSQYIKMAITAVIVFMCMFGVGANLENLVAVYANKVSKPLFVIPYLEESVTAMELVGIAIGACLAGGFMWTKHWIINNIFGVSFALTGIKMIGLSSYKVGAIMLVGLFWYDVFWVFGSKSVFGSNVMVSVAKGVEAPIKLLFPRSMGGCGDLLHSMLGLGDIVVPGIFIGFLAKWDAHLIGEKKSNSFVYLNTVMVAYFLSLVTTVCSMLLFNAAQPALLYIVPYVLLTSIGVAFSRGEMKALWAYDVEEAPAEPQGDGVAADAADKKEQ